MANELVVIENHLKAIRPRLEAALGGIMPSNRLEQTVLVSCERTPKLLGCDPQSIMNASMTFAVLGLPVDGATGQGFLVPFKGRAQALIGYRGYNTLGARAGLTITAGVVREGDEFDFERGSSAYVRHKPQLGNRGRILAFWACANAVDRPPIIDVLSIDDVLAVKATSAAVKAGMPTPWNDPEVGFPAMGEKTARRRLARSAPLRIDQPQYHVAARIEEAFDEQGRGAWATPERGVVIDGEPASLAIEHRNRDTPTAERLLSPDDVEATLKKAAETGGTPALQAAWQNLTPREQHQWKRMKDLHFKPMAEKVDGELRAQRAQHEEEST